jgi:hypothetical protein
MRCEGNGAQGLGDLGGVRGEPPYPLVLEDRWSFSGGHREGRRLLDSCKVIN